MLLSFLFLAEGGGFNPLDLSQLSNAFWTWLIFLAALPFMWMFVFKPISKALETRDSKAEEAVKAAEEARRGAETAKTQSEAQLANVKAEGQKILADAQTKAESRFKEITAQAQVEATKNLERAQQEISREKEKALSEIRDEVVNLSLGAAEKVIARKITDEDSKKFVRDLVQKVPSMK